MKAILKTGVVALASIVALTGCIKETFPTSVATNEQVNANPAALESMVQGMAAFVNKYDVLNSERHHDFGYPAIGLVRDLMCDNMSACTEYNSWWSSWMQNQYQSEDYIYSQFIWNYYTQFLFTANAIIAAVDENSANDLQKAYLGMAYCYRSLANLDMGRMYEFKPNNYTSKDDVVGLTIPIIGATMTEEEARNNPRVSKEVLVAYIEEDLDHALELFGTGFKRANKNQPDQSVAYGLKARLYMWAENYAKAKEAAQNAITAGGYTRTTEAQWIDPTTGFNTPTNAWMWCSTTVKEDDVVQTGIINFTSWMASETSFSYVGAGSYRLAASGFYEKISNTDFRKKSWKAPEGVNLSIPYIAAAGDYAGSEYLPDLAAVKFRPGSGEPNDYQVACVVSYPMMRMEEMEFIIAECDARNGSSASLVDIMLTRDPNYTCNKTGDDLIEEVFFQKTVELWGEGQILFDYKRLNHSIIRNYPGTNYFPEAAFNTTGLAPWMNFCIVRTEKNANSALVGYENPDPSGLHD